MNKLGSENFIRLIVALLFGSILLVGGIAAYKALNKRTSEQLSINDSINRWKQSYKALQVVVREWNATFHSSANRLDDRGIISLINLSGAGLTAETDYLVLVSNTQVTSHNQDLGLSKICLGTKGENFMISAPTYGELLSGLDRLAARTDLTINTVTIVGEAAFPQASLGGFCVLIRNEPPKFK